MEGISWGTNFGSAILFPFKVTFLKAAISSVVTFAVYYSFYNQRTLSNFGRVQHFHYIYSLTILIIINKI